MNSAYRNLLGEDLSNIDRRVYSDEAFFREEMSKIFGRAWLFVGHESQIPNIGDFLQSRMGIDSVVMTRDQQGGVQVLHNSCRHRGMKVCRYDEGNTRRFNCPYHAWTFGLEGELISLPYASEVYAGVDKSQWGLKKAAQVASFRGFVFATWDATAPSFDEYLGKLRQPLWEAIGPWDGGDGDVEMLGGPLKWIVPCNWKLIAENFAGDALHGPSHASVDMIRLGSGGRRDPLGDLFNAYYPEGHGFVVETFDATEARPYYPGSPAAAAYYADTFNKRKEKLGELTGTSLVLGTIFPNTSIHTSQPRSILVAHPISWDKAEMWRMWYVDKDAPQEVKDYLRRYYLAYGGPGGLTEQDDMENWIYAFQGTISDEARRMPFNYAAGLGETDENASFPGTVSKSAFSEQNVRHYYRRWAEYMDASSWTDLAV